MTELRTYSAVINGLATTLLLTAEEARIRGLVETAQADAERADRPADRAVDQAEDEPAGKARTARNKAR